VKPKAANFWPNRIQNKDFIVLFLIAAIVRRLAISRTIPAKLQGCPVSFQILLLPSVWLLGRPPRQLAELLADMLFNGFHV